MQLQRQSEERGDRPAGQVVTGGAQPAGQDDQIGWRTPVTRERFGQCHAQPFRTVPDHALAVYGNAKLSQTAGQKSGIGVHNIPQQQLGSHTQDLGCAYLPRMPVSVHYAFPPPYIEPLL